jgi:hypothetical protein
VRAVYGLTYVSGTTYTPYWWGETIAGAILAVCLLAWVPRRSRNAAVATLVGAGTAVAFVVVYSADLIAVLP